MIFKLISRRRNERACLAAALRRAQLSRVLLPHTLRRENLFTACVHMQRFFQTENGEREGSFDATTRERTSRETTRPRLSARISHTPDEPFVHKWDVHFCCTQKRRKTV